MRKITPKGPTRAPVGGNYHATIERAHDAVLAERRAVTRDLGGSAATRAMTEAIVGKLEK